MAKLTRLHRIGQVRASEIIRWRENHGYFPTIESITQVPGIGGGIFSGIRTQITAECTFWVLEDRHFVILREYSDVTHFGLESISARHISKRFQRWIIDWWVSREEQAEFEFEWIKKLTVIHSEVVSELPPIPAVISVETTRQHIEQIRPTWEREHRLGRLLNGQAMFLSRAIDWLQPKQHSFRRKNIHSLIVGGVTWWGIYFQWELSLYAVVNAVGFPISMLSAIPLLWFGHTSYLFLMYGFFAFVIYLERRQGLRAALLVWIILLLT